MLTWLGLATIVGVLALILFRVTSVLVALTLVPIAAALAGGFGGQIGGFAMEGIASVAPVAALLAFAVVYFGVMNDAGLFDPAIRAILKVVHRSPVRIAVGTAAIASLARTAGANEIYEMFFRFGARDFRSIGHKAIYVANSCRTLQCIGWQHAGSAPLICRMCTADAGVHRAGSFHGTPALATAAAMRSAWSHASRCAMKPPLDCPAT